MSGLKSRRKGSRNEYLVRDYFRSLGYEAHRIPASGAAQGFKGDIQVKSGDAVFTIEVKSRKNSFKWLYQFLADGMQITKFMYSSYTLPVPNAYHFYCGPHLITISTDFKELLHTNKIYLTKPVQPDKIIKRFEKLKELKGPSDYLVVRDDHKPALFIRFE